MTRNRASAKKAGSWFERFIADYLARVLDDESIDRRVKTGNKDRGDVSNVRRSSGQGFGRSARVVVECKYETTGLKLPEWTREAQVEAGNDDALVGVVVHKRHGNRNPAEQWVTMTVADLVALLTGEPAIEVDESPEVAA